MNHDEILSIIEKYKKQFLEDYSAYTKLYANEDIDLNIRFKKISYLKEFITITGEIHLIPYKTNRNGNRYWKYFSAKLITYRKRGDDYRIISNYRKSKLLNNFLDRQYKKVLSSSPYLACKEDLYNLILRIIYFPRFQGLPETYHGKNLQIIYLLIMLLFLGVVIFTIPTWHKWY